MGVHVDNAFSEVVPEEEPRAESGGGGASSPWEEAERVAAAVARAAMERARTGAEGFDD
jgi:hypothetical protein